jgi:uncharacterized protein
MSRFVPFRSRALAAVTTTKLVVGDLGATFDGYTIVVLADFHHRPSLADLGWLRHVVDVTNAASPDLIALLGDYGSSFRRAPELSRRWYRRALAAMTPELSRLSARDGIVSVLGNHDYYASAAIVEEWLRGLGADVLVNRARRFVRSTDVLRVAGVDDLSEGALVPSAGCDVTEPVPTIVLSHNPDGILHLDPGLRVDAVLAGHTHGGQIVLPGYGAPLRMARVCGRRSASGWVPNPRAPLYVTRGVGEQLPLPLRVNCPPEIVVLRLTRGGQQPA